MTAAAQACLFVSLLLSAHASIRLQHPATDANALADTPAGTTAKSRNRHVDVVNYKRFLQLAHNHARLRHVFGLFHLASSVSLKKRHLFDRHKKDRIISVQLPFHTTSEAMRTRDERKEELIRTLSTLAHLANTG